MITWTVPLTEYTNNADKSVIVCHWRCNAEETTGEGDAAVTYTASSYGTCGFNPDPSAPNYIPYADLTQEIVLGWVYDSVDKDATEASLQANIDLQINPVTASGVPW